MATNTRLTDQTVQVSEGPPDPALLKIRDIVYQVSGIYQPENKLYLLSNRCERRMKAVGAESVRKYLDHLTVRSTRETELRELLNEITIGETCLFRNMPQIEALRKVVLPQVVLAKKKLGFPRLRIWSAGCSTGEEPHTLGMIALEDSSGVLENCKVDIQATDLNDRSLETAKKGVYGEYALRNTSEYFKRKYGVSEGENLRIRDEVRALITFNRLNLQDDSRMVFMKGFDVIYCCNVLIYFDGASKSRVIQHFYNNLLPGGYFFLGHSESLFQINEQFHLVHFPGATAYWKPTAVRPGGGTK